MRVNNRVNVLLLFVLNGFQPCLCHKNATVLSSLFESLQRAHQNPACKAIVVTGSNQNFSPGFDINQFKKQVVRRRHSIEGSSL